MLVILIGGRDVSTSRPIPVDASSLARTCVLMCGSSTTTYKVVVAGWGAATLYNLVYLSVV